MACSDFRVDGTVVNPIYRDPINRVPQFTGPNSLPQETR